MTKPRPAFNPAAKPRTQKLGKPPGFQKPGEKGTPYVFKLRMIRALDAACFARNEISVTAFRVGLYLVDQARPVLGYADPQQGQIERAIGRQRRQVNYALAELERAEWIRRDIIQRPTRYYPNWLRVVFPDEYRELFDTENNDRSNIIRLVAPDPT